MNIDNIKFGDILDAYIEGSPTQRVMVVAKGEELIYGINSDDKEFAIDPKNEIEKVIVNINDL